MITQEQTLPLRYSDDELSEFKQNINAKLEKAGKELEYLNTLLTTDDPENKFEKDQIDQMIARQKTFIDNLNKALARIEDGSYGICRITGKLIDKARLLAVPHATLSIEAKLAQGVSPPASVKTSKPKKERKKKEPAEGIVEKAPVRYHDDELRNFKTIISNKLDLANEELKYLKTVLSDRNRGLRIEGFEDMPPDEVQALINRQNSFISELEQALDRVKKKTFGICEETGELIPKEMLLRHPIIRRLKGTPEHRSVTIEHKNDSVRKCRICGCTDDDCHQCIEKTGEACHWIDTDLCSACEEEAMKESEVQTVAGTEETMDGEPAAGEQIQQPELKEDLSQSNNNEMNFFTQLAGHGNIDLTMRIMQDKNGKLTMEIRPGPKSTSLKPILVTGTPAELDEGFFKTIAPGVQEIAGLITNIDDVKKDAEKKVQDEKNKPAPAKAATKNQKWKSPVKKKAAPKPAANKPEPKNSAPKLKTAAEKAEEVKSEPAKEKETITAPEQPVV